MANKAEDTDKAAPRPSVVSAAVLRAIDACLHALQRLRSRFEVPAEDKDAKRDGGRRSQSAPELAPATEEAAPHSKGFLYRALIVLLCLLLGSAAGATLAYRVFSKKLESHATVVERIEDELDIAKKEEARSVNLMAKFQKENAEFRLEVREAQREVEDYKRRIDELEKQQAATKRIERPVSSSGRAAVPAATAKPRAPEKTGTCTVGPGNPSGSLSDCIDKFNRP
jgi:hypothetical protein